MKLKRLNSKKLLATYEKMNSYHQKLDDEAMKMLQAMYPGNWERNYESEDIFDYSLTVGKTTVCFSLYIHSIEDSCFGIYTDDEESLFSLEEFNEEYPKEFILNTFK